MSSSLFIVGIDLFDIYCLDLVGQQLLYAVTFYLDVACAMYAYVMCFVPLNYRILQHCCSVNLTVFCKCLQCALHLY